MRHEQDPEDVTKPAGQTASDAGQGNAQMVTDPVYRVLSSGQPSGMPIGYGALDAYSGARRFKRPLVWLTC